MLITSNVIMMDYYGVSQAGQHFIKSINLNVDNFWANIFV